MYLRLELLGMYLEIGNAKPDEPDTEDSAPDNAPQPMVVSSEEPTDEVGFRSSAARGRA